LGTDPNDPDSDDDGLIDGREIHETQTDPMDDDSDDDGLLDGDEVDTWSSDPNDEDTDGDTLLDGDEVTAGTSPILDDTDGDGLTDDREPLYGTNPTLDDTDGDGLHDGDEIGLGTNPNLQDSDGDTLSDGDEVHVHGTNPMSRDTDGDGIPDNIELQFLLNPTLRDSDGGGVDDGQELVDGTDPRDPLDDLVGACTYPDVPVRDLAWVPPQPTFDPMFFEVSMDLAQDGAGGVRDYAELGTDHSSELRVDLFGPEFDPLCTVRFDLSNATQANTAGFAIAGGNGTLYDAWDLNLSEGITDCPAMDPVVYGSADIRQVLAAMPWAAALGDLGVLTAATRAYVQSTGGNWNADWDPYVDGAYFSWDGTTMLASDWAFVDQMVCDDVVLVQGERVHQPAAAVGSVPEGLISAPPLALWAADQMLPTCDVPSYTITPAFTLAPPVVTPAYFAVTASIVPTLRGEVMDMRYDSDLDGIEEIWSSYVDIIAFDANYQYLCDVVYDASTAQEIDPSTLTSASGGLYRAWAMDLVDGNSNCPAIDPLVFGTTDFRDLFLPPTAFRLAVGELQDILPYMQPQYSGDHAMYAGFDGINVYELDAANAYDIDDCFVRDPANVIQPAQLVQQQAIVNDVGSWLYFLFNL
ncbi:MAG: hypothetical protein KC621_21430, partial [Myxococcales bacterium]|nr:hypothetical protein [Myxococcales bacterium]